jgi:S-DNA-T family DNA segregation ATPase FtsK/SpoIIIE
MNKKTIDIPLDDAVSGDFANREPAREEAPLFDETPAVPTPDQLLRQKTEEPRAEPEITVSAPPPDEEIYDLPLDIPFMEAQLKPVPGSGRKSGFSVPATAAVTVTLEPSKGGAKKSGTDADSGKAAGFDIASPISGDSAAYVFPPAELLSVGNNSADSGAAAEVAQNTERLESAFGSFGVRVKITNTTRGPSVTRYEAELEVGVKLSKVTGLADDIALSLGSGGVRIAAMPNRISTIGIEVPNKVVSTVYLHDLIKSPEFNKAASRLSFAIGKSIAGESIIGNIAKLPHMLVAGTTGSGKSVCLNSLILSILYKATPDDVRLIMIDPKMVEFRVYNGIPHLLVPVVTEAKKASGALQWAVIEMMRRYKFFSEANARDLEGYNNAMRRVEGGEPLPQIVVIIDELADLMMTCAKEVEDSIVRIAQMGRAAGVHLVIATQSPRADVITGLMKANIPSRIALKVSSALESRIILDAGGAADKLIGNGDMLYAPIGAQKPLRVQGTWVTDEERENVVEFIKNRGETQYSEEVMSEIEKAAVSKEKEDTGGANDDSSPDNPFGADYDELLPQAVDVIFESAQASTSMLQRRLKLGYSRAARIIDQLEELGILGPFEGSKPRQILMTKERWRELQYSKGGIPADSFLIEPDDFNMEE